jgi:hypothetical protein
MRWSTPALSCALREVPAVLYGAGAHDRASSEAVTRAMDESSDLRSSVVRVEIAPETELTLLLECAEDAFPMGRADNVKWQTEHPGASPTVDVFRQFETNGWVRFDEVVDPADGRSIVRPRLTAAGQARIAELNRQGIQPGPAIDAHD